MASLPAGVEPFSIRIYLADGTADGLRLVEKPGWTGCGVLCPRTKFPELRKRPEFERPGVYFLLGDAMADRRQEIYIGEGDPVSSRLTQHFREKDFWSSLIFFTSRDENLHKAHIQYLESNLLRLAGQANRSSLANRNLPYEPSLSEIDRADMKAFLGHLLLVLNVLGVSTFQEPDALASATIEFSLEGKGLRSTGYETDEGFVVRKGSRAPLETSQDGVNRALREQLVQDGIFSADNGYLLLTQDYVFSSPSRAASLMLGRGANGRAEWRAGDGRTLKQVQESELDDTV